MTEVHILRMVRHLEQTPKNNVTSVVSKYHLCCAKQYEFMHNLKCQVVWVKNHPILRQTNHILWIDEPHMRPLGLTRIAEQCVAAFALEDHFTHHYFSHKHTTQQLEMADQHSRKSTIPPRG